MCNLSVIKLSLHPNYDNIMSWEPFLKTLRKNYSETERHRNPVLKRQIRTVGVIYTGFGRSSSGEHKYMWQICCQCVCHNISSKTKNVNIIVVTD